MTPEERAEDIVERMPDRYPSEPIDEAHLKQAIAQAIREALDERDRSWAETMREVEHVATNTQERLGALADSIAHGVNHARRSIKQACLFAAESTPLPEDMDGGRLHAFTAGVHAASDAVASVEVE